MRIAFVLVLLLVASARPASAQYAHLQPAQQALPASLIPPVTSTDPLVSQPQRDHWKGAQIGSVVGAVAGVLVATLHSCPDYADGAAYCKLAGIGVGALAGAIVGGLIGVPYPTTR